MTDAPTPASPPRQIMARLRQPLPVKGLVSLADSLEDAYGPGLTMESDGDWLVIRQPEARTSHAWDSRG